MSVSESGSDVTIPIQDSPPPPPSPFASSNNKGRKSPDPKGVDNAGYEPCENEKDEKKRSNNSKEMQKRGDHTQIPMNGQDPPPPLLNEALNSELINLNIMNSIPDKPQPEFGPYENPDEYFIAVNQHKKFLRRSEKLYVTKDKRKANPWRKYMCWLIGAVILATVITVAVSVGLISQKTTSPTYQENILGTTSSAELVSSSSLGPFSSTSSELDADDWIAGSASTTSKTTSGDVLPSLATRPTLNENYVPAAADLTFTLDNAEYTAALNNKSSDKFHELASEIEQEIRNRLRSQAGLTNAYAKVMEFLPGSIVVKMRLSWVDEQKDLMDVQMFMSSLRNLGEYELRHGATSSYGLVNHCKFGNYGCSHYCTFDYEQLDFLCTCPEYLRLAEDKKLCVENSTTLGVLTTTDSDVTAPGKETDVSLKPQVDQHDTTDETEQTLVQQQQPSEESVTDEPLVIPQSVSTQSSHHAHDDHEHEHEHMAAPITTVSPSTSTTSTSTASPKDPENIEIPVTTEDSIKINETNADEVHQTLPRDSEQQAGEGAEEEPAAVAPAISQRNSSPSIISLLDDDDDEITTPYPMADEEMNSSRSLNKKGEEGENEPEEIPNLPHDNANNDDDVPTGVTDPSLMEMTTISSHPSEEELSNEAPLLQRSGNDNYSEVEQNQHSPSSSRVVTPSTTTSTVPPPKVSFNSSRYSEENNNNNNGSNTLSSSQESLSEESIVPPHPAIIVEDSTNPSNEAELLATDDAEVPANNSTARSKSARYESFGEAPHDSEQTQHPHPHSPSTNASSRSVLTNSAEFMVYGDNVLGENRNPSQGGTDSGLTDDGSSQQHHNILGRLNLNRNDTEAELPEGNSGATESDINHNISGSVEVVSGETFIGLGGGDSSSSKKDESVEEPSVAGLIFSGSVKNKVGGTNTESSHRDTEEYTTPFPVNLENDTLVNENATEDRTNVETNVNSDDVIVPTTSSPNQQQQQQQQQQKQNQGVDESIVVEESPDNSVGVTEMPRLSEGEISNDEPIENDSPVTNNSSTADSKKEDVSISGAVTERQSNDEEEIVTEAVVNHDDDVLEDEVEVTTTLAPKIVNSLSSSNLNVASPPLVNSSSISHDDINHSLVNTTINLNESSSGVITSTTTTTTTTTIKPSNLVNQTTVDNENELS